MGLEVSDDFGALGVVFAEGCDIVPHGDVGETETEDACLEVLDLNGTHGLDPVEDIGENATSAAGEKVQ